MDYKNSSDEEILKNINNDYAWNEFVERFSEYIYNYPLFNRKFYVDGDYLSDFYIYAMERLRKRLKKYNPHKGKVKTFISIILFNLQIDFNRKNKGKDKTFSLDNTTDSDEQITYKDLLGAEDKNIENLFSEPDLKLRSIVQGLPMENRVTFKLQYIKYIELTNEEYKWLRELLNKELLDLISAISNLKSKAGNKEQNVIKIETELNRLHLSCLDLTEQIKVNDNIEKNEKLNKKLTKQNERREKLLDEYYSPNNITRLNHSDIAGFLNIPEGTVSARLSRVKKIIREQYIGAV